MIVLSAAYEDALAFWLDSGTVTTSEIATYRSLVLFRPDYSYSLANGETAQVERRREFPTIIPKEWT